MFHGAPLQDDQELTLAVNNYRYSSALKAQSIISGTKEWESSNSIRDMIVAYFAEHSPVAPEVDHNWKIVGVDLSEDDPRRAELVATSTPACWTPPTPRATTCPTMIPWWPRPRQRPRLSP